MNFVDFHVHIDYYKNYSEIFDYYNKNKIYTLFVTNLPEVYENCMVHFEQSKYVKLALGYNPQFAGIEKFNKEIFDKYFVTTKYIGEVGLDFSTNFIEHKVKQIDTFEYIANKSGQQNKILSIHSRAAEEYALRILKECNVKFAVFHWYTGSMENIKKIIDMGYYFSLNSQMLLSSRNLDLFNKMPMDRILIETDGPFTYFNKKIMTPDKLPELYNEFNKKLNTNNLKEIVFNNLKKLLNCQDNFIN